jgi:hypothetical protein
MSDTPNIDDLKDHATKLVKLLAEPEPGFSTWHIMLNERLAAVSQFYTGKGGCGNCGRVFEQHSGLTDPVCRNYWADWTRGPDGRSNTSAAFSALVEVVYKILREGGAGGILSDTWLLGRAGLIVAQLAHVHGMRPGK